MKVIEFTWEDVSRSQEFTIIPISDIHIGAKSCDEKRLRRTVERIKDDPNCYWIGGGDYCDLISVKDKRFDPSQLADWITTPDLIDIPKAQFNRIMEYLAPIASKCLGMIEGNHETFIKQRYERDIYLEIVSAVKQEGGFPADKSLALGYNGWIALRFARSKSKGRNSGVRVIKISLHHGFVGGKLAGAKALNMQRWLWSHDCDIAVFGHSHNTGVQIEAIEWVNNGMKVEHANRYGVYAGSYLKSFSNDNNSTYAESKGYFPQGMAASRSSCVLWLRPGMSKSESQQSWGSIATARDLDIMVCSNLYMY